jgi:hypothetical protein
MRSCFMGSSFFFFSLSAIGERVTEDLELKTLFQTCQETHNNSGETRRVNSMDASSAPFSAIVSQSQ